MTRRTTHRWTIAAALAAVLAGCTPTGTPPTPTTTTVVDPLPATPVGDDAIRLNQIQEIGTHNSYHVAPEPRILNALRLASSLFPQVAAGLGDPAGIDYTHAPLATQLSRGTRSFEIDIYADPTGGRFANPGIPQLLGLTDTPLPEHMDQPGFKVIHIVDIDYISTCSTLQLCLAEIRTWSDAHPGHLPITIDLELKDDNLPAPFNVTPIQPFDGPTLDAVDAELRAGLGNKLLTPDDVRGSAPDLHTAVTTTGWPTVRDSRGKVLVYMDNENLRSAYVAGHPTLEGRAMFTSSGQGQPDGAVLKVNEPGDGSVIRSLVQQGYIVRTRADADIVGTASGDTTRRDTALASGAQVVSTDFPTGEPRADNGYVVAFNTRIQARCNPVITTPATCAPAAVVEPN